jgi:hypothetical protein
MGSFLGVTAVQWQNGTRVAIGVLILSAIGLAVTEYAQRQPVWCAGGGLGGGSQGGRGRVMRTRRPRRRGAAGMGAGAATAWRAGAPVPALTLLPPVAARTPAPSRRIEYAPIIANGLQVGVVVVVGGGGA